MGSLMEPTQNPPSTAMGEEHPPSIVFRARFALLKRSIKRAAGTFEGKRIADFGCGYNAPWVRPVLPDVASAVLVDVSLSDVLKANPKVQAIEGSIPDALADLPPASLDIVLCISSLEHLNDVTETLAQCWRLLAPDGILVVNVPAWRSKVILEFLAFRLGLGLNDIDGHKMYYNSRDLWPLLRRAGFLPHNISCRPYPFGSGLTTFAVCRR